MRHILLIAAVSLTLAACADDDSPSSDAGTQQADAAADAANNASTDAGSPSDASSTPDADAPDMAPVDMGRDMPPEVILDWEPLYDENTELDPELVEDTGAALISHFADRGRDRHARESAFQAYEHYLSWYWEDRTIGVTVTDTVGRGGDTVRFDIVSPHQFGAREFRAFFFGRNTVAEYCYNVNMDPANPDGSLMPMTEYSSRDPDQTTYYTVTLTQYQVPVSCAVQPLAQGQGIEIEISQFLDRPNNGRSNYYGTTFLYVVGEGIVPWASTGQATGCCGNGYAAESQPIPLERRLGGATTTHRSESNEPDNLFMQLATNTAPKHAQPFMQGRRLVHTSFVDGQHDENPVENPPQAQYAGAAGPAFVNDSCNSCHLKNGRALPANVGEPLPQWVFKVGDGQGGQDPQKGNVWQPLGPESEGAITLGEWVEQDGLRAPTFVYEGGEPVAVSPRISPQLVGMGLLEAIPEAAVEALADPNDDDGDGISGRMHVVQDSDGINRLGRFGYKASQPTVRAQVAAALQTDMGVTTSMFPTHDCGPSQTGCAEVSQELADPQLDELTLYISLLGVQPQAEHDGVGEGIFADTGCTDCHNPSFQTSEFAPLAELRSQTIYPYTDLLLHDMGPGLADTYLDGNARGREWRTAPLWGLGKSEGVAGGGSFLHDGRARTIDEAIRWHGGEAQRSKVAYEALSDEDREALLEFLRSL